MMSSATVWCLLTCLLLLVLVCQLVLLAARPDSADLEKRCGITQGHGEESTSWQNWAEVESRQAAHEASLLFFE